MKLQSIHKYSSSVLEPLLLYVGLIYIIHWVNTSSEQSLVRITISAIYTILPLFIIRILHQERLTSRLGLKRGVPLIGLYYCIGAVGTVAVSATLISYYPTVKIDQLYGLAVGPIVEEIFFRGYILVNLSKLNKYVALGVSTFLFSAAHYETYSITAGHVVGHFIGGLIMGGAYLYFGSILVPITIHQAANIMLGGFSPPHSFPWNFVGYLVYFAPISAGLITFYEIYKKPAPSCWVCGRTESSIRRRFPQIKDVLKNYPVEGGTVKICFVCKQLHLTASEKSSKE